MYFWKIKLLKEDIINERVTTSMHTQYKRAYILLYIFLLLSSLWQFYKVWGVEMVAVQGFISIFGIYYLYYIYQKISRVSFTRDLFSVGFVFLLRSIFFMSIGMLNLYFMTWVLDVEKLFSTQNSMIIGMVFEFLLYWRIGKHLKSLAQ